MKIKKDRRKKQTHRFFGSGINGTEAKLKSRADLGFENLTASSEAELMEPLFPRFPR